MAEIYILGSKSNPKVSKFGKAEVTEERFKSFNPIGYCGYSDWYIIWTASLDDDSCAREAEKQISKDLKRRGHHLGKVDHLTPATGDYTRGTETYDITPEELIILCNSTILPRNRRIQELEKMILAQCIRDEEQDKRIQELEKRLAKAGI